LVGAAASAVGVALLVVAQQGPVALGPPAAGRAV